MKRRLLTLMSAAALAACSTGRLPPVPDAGLPAAYPGAAAQPGSSVAPDWWKLFGEPQLDSLVELTLAHNVDLAIAAARVDEVAVAVGLARAAQWPSIDLNGSVTRSRSSTLSGQQVTQAEVTTHRLTLNTTFEIDVWGKLRNATAAAQQQLLAAQYGRDTVRIALAGTVAQAYFGLRALDAQLRVIDAQLRQRQDSLNLVERRANAGIASGLEVAQARAALAATAALRPELQRQRTVLSNALGVLSGQLGLAMGRQDRVLPAPAVVPAGLPSQLLERRPDIRQGEAAMRASFEQFEVVRKSAFPTLALTGSFGAQSADLTELLKSGARVWSIGPSILASIFDAGTRQARTDEARARAEQAALGYQKAVQTAFREVADALAAAEQSSLQEAEVERQRAAASEVLRLATRRYEAGYSGYLEVLDAQRGVQEAELALVRSRQARLDAAVVLMKSLGGGWSDTVRTSAAHASGDEGR